MNIIVFWLGLIALVGLIAFMVELFNSQSKELLADLYCIQRKIIFIYTWGMI